MTKILLNAAGLEFLTVTNTSGQNILQDYFIRNKNNLVIGSIKHFNISEPSFKPAKPTNIFNEIEFVIKRFSKL